MLDELRVEETSERGGVNEAGCGFRREREVAVEERGGVLNGTTGRVKEVELTF